MQLRGQLLEDRGVLADEPEERRTPRADGDWIDQYEPLIPCVMQQHRPQRDRPTEVMRDHARFIEPPLREQLDEHPTLRGERDVLSL